MIVPLLVHPAEVTHIQLEYALLLTTASTILLLCLFHIIGRARMQMAKRSRGRL